MKEVFSLLYTLVFCCNILLSGCVSKSSKEVPPDNKSLSKQYKVIQKQFADRNPMIISQIGKLKVTTRVATTAEIPEDLSKIGLVFSAEGAGSLGLSLVAAPMYGGALAMGGIILIPGGILLYSHEKGIWDSISTALSEFKLTHTIDSKLKDKLYISFTKESAPDLKIEIIIVGFGISSASPNCLILSADFVVNQNDKELIRDQLNITSTMRSKDAPPPQCASLENFAANKARLVKEILNEYAEVLAVMAIERIPKENRK